MNTTRIGTEYERAYRRELEAKGLYVTRSAASKGLFDLVASDASVCWHVQLKRGYISCYSASKTAAYNKGAIGPGCKSLLVHHRKYDGEEDTDFCEHVG